jgi:hypothetical protein
VVFAVITENRCARALRATDFPLEENTSVFIEALLEQGVLQACVKGELPILVLMPRHVSAQVPLRIVFRCAHVPVIAKLGRIELFE